jgi:hypothetical protein
MSSSFAQFQPKVRLDLGRDSDSTATEFHAVKGVGLVVVFGVSKLGGCALAVLILDPKLKVWVKNQSWVMFSEPAMASPVIRRVARGVFDTFGSG